MQTFQCPGYHGHSQQLVRQARSPARHRCLSIAPKAQQQAKMQHGTQTKHPQLPLIYVIMGVSGCGKSSVGALLAQKLHCPFYDADDYHPASNISKMHAGIPLTDEDRWPWLQRLADALAKHVQEHSRAVLACSALKPAYRQILLSAVQHADVSKDASSSALQAEQVMHGQLQQQDDSSQAANMAGTGAPAADSNQQQAVQTGAAQQQTQAASRLNSASVLQQEQNIQRTQPPTIAFVLLNPSIEELEARLKLRAAQGQHFMPPSLLASQLQQLCWQPGEMYMVFDSNGTDNGQNNSSGGAESRSNSSAAVAAERDVLSVVVQGSTVTLLAEQIVNAILIKQNSSTG